MCICVGFFVWLSRYDISCMLQFFGERNFKISDDLVFHPFHSDTERDTWPSYVHFII